jgi:hypothetical protein
MKIKHIFLFVILSGATLVCNGQGVGLSFSYFIPKNGYFSTPISPFSIRGLGVDLNRFLALEAGASLYRMNGLNMKDLPFESKEPFVGPNFTIFVPVELVVQLKAQAVELDLKAGVFGFHGFGQKLNYGNIDRAIRKMEGWDVANSSFEFRNKPGWGYHAGTELTFYLRRDFGISLEANYLIGESQLPLEGSYTGGGPDEIATIQVNYPDAKIDFTGMEFSIGLIFNSGGGAPAPKKSNRRRR